MKEHKGRGLFIACIAILLCFMLLSFLSGDGGPLYFARTLLSYPLIFFVPGAFWFLAFSSKRERSYLEFLLGGVGVSIAVVIILTTIMKLCGIAVSLGSLIAVVALSLLGGYFCFALRGRCVVLVDDLSCRWLSLACLGVALIGLYVCFGGYFNWDISRHWVAVGNPINPIDPAQQLYDWKFPEPEELAQVRVSYPDGANVIGERRVRATEGVFEFSLYNDDDSVQPYTLMFFFQSRSPCTLKAYCNGRLLEERRVGRLIDVRCEHLFPRYNRLAWIKTVSLAQGLNNIRFTFTDSAGSDSDVIIDDFSNLTKQQFLALAHQQYLFGEIGVFYDNIEVLDFSRHFFTKSFTYTDDLRTGVPGYTIVIPPHDFFVKMFFLCAGRNELHDFKYLYLARLAILFLVFLLYFGHGREPVAFRFTILPIFVILAESINIINFRLVAGHDTMMCVWFLLAAYFLVRGRDGLFLLFAAFLCLSRNHGVVFVLLMILSHAVYFGQKRRLIRLLGIIFLMGIAYIGIVLAIGHATGVLRTIWWQDFINENFRFRFDSGKSIEYLCRGAIVFLGWVAVTSCFQFVLIPLKKDRLSKYLLLITAIYFPLLCLAKSYKPYYLIMVVYPLSIIAARSLAQMASRRIRIAAGRRTILRFDSREALFLLMLLAGALCVAYLAVAPLIYPEFTTSFPSLYFRLFPPSP